MEHRNNPFESEADLERPILPELLKTPSTGVTPYDEQDCYFTAKAVSIRTSLASRTAITASPSPRPPTSPRSSTLITPAQFPPPPGHSHPSFVFRKTSTSQHSGGSNRGSTSSSWTTSSPQLPKSGGRESMRSATPSQFPQPPSSNGRDATAPHSFAARASGLSMISLPAPNPPPKEYHPALSPAARDYFSPSGASFSPFPSQTPQTARESRQIAGANRPAARPAPLNVSCSSAASSPLLSPPQPPYQQHQQQQQQHQQQSPISPQSPFLSPNLSPLTIQTLTHLSNTALRSPSLACVEPEFSPQLSNTGSASPLTSAQRDRLWEMKRAYYEGKARHARKSDEKGWLKTRKAKVATGMKGYLWAVIGVSILALAGIVGLIVALTAAQGKGS